MVESSESVTVSLYPTPGELGDNDLRGRSCIVIDVLRSSSSIITALAHGAREVIPVLTPAEAGQLAMRTGRDTTVLAGEREGRRIDGFDLGNSPFEYTPDRVSGRTIVFSSTNGSAAILRARSADRVYVGGFNNAGAVVKRVIADRRPVVILCAGHLDQFAIEDVVCGGKFVSLLENRFRRPVLLNDAARAAALLYRHFDGSLLGLMKSCAHGADLLALGFGDDLEYCVRQDSHSVIPMFVEGKLRGYTADGNPFADSRLAH